MLTAARLREYTGPSRLLDLLRDLGYPVAPVDVDPVEWRRGGVEMPWSDDTRIRLAARLRHFDLFVLEGQVEQESIAIFLTSYRSYNRLIKSAIITTHNSESDLSLFDLAADGQLRRFDLDLHDPAPGALDRLNLLAACADETELPRVFDRALDREAVTREFFHRFRSAVRDVARALAALFPQEPQDAIDAEALLILSRLLFLEFVQHKGWLNGERRFLVDRLARETREGREFFSGVLLPLFFECLNTPLHDRTLAARRLGRIPYLNGGLFEPAPFERRHAEIHLSNALMHRVLEGLFARFEFRIEEDGAAGAQVDPEMLGKVFESLMAEDERLSSGSFYTPREVVDVLVARALEEWRGRATPDELLERLETITVLDPACGSGAFLLSALGAIEKLWHDLATRAGVPIPRDLRRRIVAGSLYGVDLKPEAVRLCELRLWLAIVSGTDCAIEEVEPLPNLDRNILQGNTLLSPTDFLGDARMDIYARWLFGLRAQRDLIERYRTAPHAQRPSLHRLIRGNDQRLAGELLSRAIADAEKDLQSASAPQRDLFGRALPLDVALCQSLQQRITDLRSQLERAEDGELGFFSFDIHFAPVMARGGFDIVAGNPPWVRNSRIDPRVKRMLRDRYVLFRSRGEGAAFHQPDLSVAFFERALKLAAPHGVVALLMPAKILNATYAAPLRQAAHARVAALDDWSDDPRRRRWFEADTFPLGIVIRASEPADRVLASASGQSFVLSKRQLASGSAEWTLVPPRVAEILQRVREQHPTLESALGRKPFMGVKTGDNRAFFLEDAAVRNGRVSTREGISLPLSVVCRCVRGRDVRRWNAEASLWMLWPAAPRWASASRSLTRFVEARGLALEDLRLAFVRPEHVGIKVVWKDLSRRFAAAVLSDSVQIGDCAVPLVPNQTLYAIDAVSLDEAHVIAALLNSAVAGALLLSVAERAKDGHYRYFGRTVAALPWPDAEPEREQLVRLSRRAHRGADVQRAVDAAAARLYGITAAELAELQRFLAVRFGDRETS